MSASAQVLQLVRAHYRKDERAFAAAGQALARGSKIPTVRTAIMDAVRNGYATRGRDFPSPRPDQQKSAPVEAGGMLQRLNPVTFAELELEEVLQGQLDEIVTEIEYREELAERRLRPRSRLLFHGPPGNGKTSSAAAIANAIDLPAFAVNLGELISKWVGATGENLTKLFNALRPDTIVVFDEIDAIGSYRGTPEQAAAKEMNSTVNSLLTLLDRNDAGIIVATTNRPDILDPALLRRFDEQLYFPEPSARQMFALAERLCTEFRVDVPDVTNCKNFDEVTKLCRTHARRAVMAELLAAERGEEAGDNGSQEKEDHR